MKCWVSRKAGNFLTLWVTYCLNEGSCSLTSFRCYWAHPVSLSAASGVHSRRRYSLTCDTYSHKLLLPTLCTIFIINCSYTISVTGYGHMQEATNFTDVGAVNNKYFEKSLKWKFACNGRLHRECVTLILQTKFFRFKEITKFLSCLGKPTLETTLNQVQRVRSFRRVRWARAALFVVDRPDRY
jgi:hypothetical protein